MAKKMNKKQQLEIVKKKHKPKKTIVKTKNLDTSIILTIQDQHFPFAHPDIMTFLKAIKRKYKPTLVVNMGDECDKHSLSFHSSDSDLPSAGHELQLAIKELHKLEKIFPEMFIIDSNHGSMATRKFKFHGIPMKYLKSMNDIYEVGDGWKWVPDLTLSLPNGQDCFFCHGITKDGIKAATQRGMCISQGHFHSVMKIEYIGNPENLLWSMQAGCLIDKHSLAFAYDKLNLNRPAIGTGIIINGHPKLIPMVLDKNGRWIGKLV